MFSSISLFSTDPKNYISLLHYHDSQHTRSHLGEWQQPPSSHRCLQRHFVVMSIGLPHFACHIKQKRRLRPNSSKRCLDTNIPPFPLTVKKGLSKLLPRRIRQTSSTGNLKTITETRSYRLRRLDADFIAEFSKAN